MADSKTYLEDVGIRELPFPIRAPSRDNPQGQLTVAEISAYARIMSEFEARWIDKFIQVLHRHRDKLSPANIKLILKDLLTELQASAVSIRFSYPFFIEKITPVSKEKCLVRYLCSLSGKTSTLEEEPTIYFSMEVPVITTYPASDPTEPGGLFGQLTILLLEIKSSKPVFPEEIVEVADRSALAPVYSFLTQEDQIYMIKKIHSEIKTSVDVVGEVKEYLAKKKEIEWYSVKAFNYGMLHNYSTVITTEKSLWIPYSIYEEQEI